MKLSVWTVDKRELEKRASEEGATVECIVSDAVAKYLNIDPKSRAEIHINLCNRYLSDAEARISEDDYVQASEKGWGAASQAVKAVALSREGKELRAHGELWEYVNKLRKELKEPAINKLWFSANSLHTNFYERWLTKDQVEDALKDVKEFVNRLKEIIQDL